MANFPNWSPTVSSGMQASSIMRLIVSNYVLLQSQIRSAMGAYGSLDTYMKALFTSQGFLVPGFMAHSKVSNLSLTTNTHHLKYHATSHVTATDAIPIVTSTKHGLISTTLYKKIYQTTTAVNARPIIVSSYTGNGTNKYIALGFRPKLIKIFQHGSLGFVFDCVWNKEAETYTSNNFGVQHRASSGGHIHKNLSTMVTCGTSGFTTHVSANVNLAKYNFLVMG